MGCQGVEEGFRGSALRVFGGRLQVDKLAAVVLHFDGCVGGERRIWVVLVVARVLICLVRAFQFFEVAVVACKFERAVGFASGTLPRRGFPPSPPLDHVQLKVLHSEVWNVE
jgi:hypothetical protein